MKWSLRWSAPGASCKFDVILSDRGLPPVFTRVGGGREG